MRRPLIPVSLMMPTEQVHAALYWRQMPVCCALIWLCLKHLKLPLACMTTRASLQPASSLINASACMCLCLRVPHTCSGIGSVLHSEAAAMSAALETGRVFLEAPGHFLTATPYCGSNTTLDSCYFEPLSNCTLEMAGVTSQVKPIGSAKTHFVLSMLENHTEREISPCKDFAPRTQHTCI
jgi:hypothetical protein